MSWDFLAHHKFQLLAAIAAYIAGAILVIKRRMRDPAAGYGVRQEAGTILVIVGNLPIIGILIYLWVAYTFLAAVTAYLIALVASFVLAALKGLFYPFLE